MNTNDEKIKSFFTAYLNVALKRERDDYLKRKVKEHIFLDMDAASLEEYVDFRQHDEAVILKEWNELFMGKNEERKKPQNEYGSELEYAVSCLTECEKLAVFFKVYFELTYKEIGGLLGVSDRKTALVYHYACKKMKRRLEKEYGI